MPDLPTHEKAKEAVVAFEKAGKPVVRCIVKGREYTLVFATGEQEGYEREIV